HLTTVAPSFMLRGAAMSARSMRSASVGCAKAVADTASVPRTSATLRNIAVTSSPHSLPRFHGLHSRLLDRRRRTVRIQKRDQPLGSFELLRAGHGGGSEDRDVLNVVRDRTDELGARDVQQLADRLNRELRFAPRDGGHGG